MGSTRRWMVAVSVMALAAFGLVTATDRPVKAADPATRPAAIAPAPISVSMVVMPHPDDEMEAWSLIENSSNNYKVFVFVTRGNSTKHCQTPARLEALQPAWGEIDPTPGTGVSFPLSREECSTLRMKSTVQFLNAMNTQDPYLPSTIQQVATMHLPLNGTTLPSGDNSVEVYDGGKYGRVLFFNLTDGTVTKAGVDWVVYSVMNHKSELGIPTNLPVYNVLGPFYNDGRYKDCTTYAHPDHFAVHDAMYHSNYGVSGYQAAATCATDRDAVMTKDVTQTSWDAAFALDQSTRQRLGLFEQHYGWLNPDLSGWNDNPSTSTQLVRGPLAHTPFMRHQSFWKRYGRQGSW